MTSPSQRTRALRWAGELLYALSTAADTTAEVKNRINLVLRHYPTEFDLSAQARLEEGSPDPYLLPEPEGSPFRPDDLIDPQGMATWEVFDGVGVLRMECASGLRFTIQPSPAYPELARELADMDGKLVSARDLLAVEPQLRQLAFNKAFGRGPEFTLLRAVGLQCDVMLQGVPGPEESDWCGRQLDLWRNFLDGR